MELDGSNNQTARNVQGTSLIARTVGGTTLYYMYNGHADVTALLDATGTIQGTYYYDAFGNITEQTGNVNNNITYAGYQYDKETGLYYLNARYYDPIIARFLSEDTFAGNPNDPLSLNLYTYCSNNPLIYWDPTGHELMAIGSKGANVVAMQQQLVVAGFLPHGSDDGDFGPQTQAAVINYQKSQKLTVDGLVGNQTITSLSTAVKLQNNSSLTQSQKVAAQNNANNTSVGELPAAYTSTTSYSSKPKYSSSPKYSSTPKSTNNIGSNGSGNSSLNQYDSTKIISPGNLTGTTAGAIEALAEAGKTYAPYSIGNAIRPNNIGVGTWNAYIESESAMAVSKLDSVAKIAKGAGKVAVGVDVAAGIYENVQAGTPINKIASDAVVDTAFDVGGAVLVGALLGSVIPGAGTLVGAGVGLGVGLIYMGVTEIWQPYGMSIKDRTKEGIYNLMR